MYLAAEKVVVVRKKVLLLYFDSLPIQRTISIDRKTLNRKLVPPLKTDPNRIGPSCIWKGKESKVHKKPPWGQGKKVQFLRSLSIRPVIYDQFCSCLLDSFNCVNQKLLMWREDQFEQYMGWVQVPQDRLFKRRTLFAMFTLAMMWLCQDRLWLINTPFLLLTMEYARYQGCKSFPISFFCLWCRDV